MKTKRSGRKDPELRSVIVAGILVLGSVVGGRGALAARDKQHPTIDVFTNNYAQVPDKTLQKAEAAATRVLSIAGINTRWHRCGESEADCIIGLKPSTPDARVRVFVLIIPRAMAARWSLGPTRLGFSIIPGGGEKGNRAYVFYHRAQEVAAGEEASDGQVLGHVMAHEIGHLLLNSNDHSNVGIMQAVWRDGQMELMREGLLLFTSAQSRRMRADLLAREKATRLLEAENARN